MNAEQQKYPKLGESIAADAVIIGGGITGLLSAYLLSEAGKKVVLLEKNALGSGATQYTTAFITQVIDTDYRDLTVMMGKPKAKLVAASHGQAIDLIEEIVTKEKIDCNFVRCSNFTYANSIKEVNELSKEAEAMKALGIKVNPLVLKNNLGFVNSGYIEVKNQAKFSARKFITSLGRILQEKGVMIFEESKADAIESDGTAAKVTSGNYTITAPIAIVATYQPFNKPLSLYFKKGFYTTYVMSASIPRGIIKEGIYEDTENPYHYFRIDPDRDHDIITIGGEDHRSLLKFNEKKIFSNLEAYLETILPEVAFKVDSRWTGPILEPVDGLPSIGRSGKENVLYAMGFSGNGMTYGAIAARIFADTILGKKNPLEKVYAAQRTPSLKSLLIKGRDYSEELGYDVYKQLSSK
ncbi:FAD-binding oxidoreductase [Candidatus Parcubacteria bacterium]|nr:FAD-binding oxidoreductase [Candidatus Parcubacteria bacterium]